MGLIGIWCMHFIGNRAIKLHDNDPDLQLVYSPGYTGLSVALPIFGLMIAFANAEVNVRQPWIHLLSLVITGILAGLSVVGMHYVGNFGITNYKLQYQSGNLAGSIILAIGDCLTVLLLFYRWREQWINAWWRRALCAAVLAGGVSAMHFTASVGCSYTLVSYNTVAAVKSRNLQVIIAGVLCGAAAIIVLGVLFFTRHRAKVLKQRAQKVMLACAIFDPDGRIMVTNEGTLPAREITDKFNYSTFSEEFSTAHHVLHWIYRVTFNWSGVADLVPKMKSHLGAHVEETEEESSPSSSSSSAIYDPSTYSDYSIIFRERFCVAAAHLAATMHIPLQKLGVLYDKIIETGTLPDDKPARRTSRAAHKALSHDLELGTKPHLFGKGQLLFLVRKVPESEADRLLNSGYRFAPIQNVGRNIAEPLQIPLTVLESHIADLKHYVDDLEKADVPGTWLSFFALIAKPHSSGFDVLVKKQDQSQLPAAQFIERPPQQSEVDFLNRMHGWSAQACVNFLDEQSESFSQFSPRDQHFAGKIRMAIFQLTKQVPSEWFRQAHFYARPKYAHYSKRLTGQPTMTTVLYSFIVMGDMHTSIDAYNDVTRAPFTFFSTRQRCYASSPDHAVLSREIHQEFGPLLARKTPKRPTGPRRILSSVSGHSRHRSKSASGMDIHRGSMARTDSSSEHELVDKPNRVAAVKEENEDDNGRDNIWGGILVNSETVIKTDHKSEYTTDSGKDLGLGLVTRVQVGTASQEETFADELYKVTTHKYMPEKPGY